MKVVIEEKREIMGKGEYIKSYCSDAEKILKKGKPKTIRKLHPELFRAIYLSVPYYCDSYEYRKSGVDLKMVMILIN